MCTDAKQRYADGFCSFVAALVVNFKKSCKLPSLNAFIAA